MELNHLVVVTGQKDVDWGIGLMSDGPQRMTVKGVGRDRLRKKNTFDPQLVGEFLIHNTGVSPGVNKGDQGLGTLLKKQPDMKHRPFL